MYRLLKQGYFNGILMCFSEFHVISDGNIDVRGWRH
jgi:hypothetical protein